jgi:hypothetical protein
MTDFEIKVNAKRYKTAELVNGNGFIEIRDSFVDEETHVAYFFGRLNGKHPGIWDDSQLKNYVI